MAAKAPPAAARDLLRVIADQAGEIARLKAEVAERSEQYRVLMRVNAHPTWVYCWDSLRFLDVNEAALATYGWSRDEFLSMTIADIRPREDVPALIENVSMMRTRPMGVTGPWRHRHKDGVLVEMAVAFQTLPFSGKSARLIVAEKMTAAPRTTGAATLPLSPREREVFGLVARGQTSQQIAGQLALSPKSVETYRARFMQKLCLKSRADIVRYALDHGLLVPAPRS
jgi:PAS domain S-box-containing protein